MGIVCHLDDDFEKERMKNSLGGTTAAAFALARSPSQCWAGEEAEEGVPWEGVTGWRQHPEQNGGSRGGVCSAPMFDVVWHPVPLLGTPSHIHK